MFVALSSSPSFTSFELIQTEVPAGTAVPTGASGAWVILVGQGGNGGSGASQSGSNHVVSGGSGGGGGARVGWGLVPVSAMGTTYSLTAGTFSSRFATFISGGVTLSAGWGNDGLSGVNSSTSGGVATQTGISGLPMGNGGSAGASTTNGAGGGGGGGGGGDSHGSGSGTAGGAGGTVTGGTYWIFAAQGGGHGAPGSGTSSLATGGAGGGGGGAGGYAGGTGGGYGQGAGGGYIRIQWV